MTNILHLDYETYSECDIKVAGAHRYARDPSTEILCLAYAMNDEEPTLFVPGDKKGLKKLLKKWRKTDYWAGHNVGFEMLITEHVGSHQLGLPPIPTNRAICTAALAAYRGYPRALDGVAQALGLIEQKDPRGTRLITKCCKPRSRVSKANPEKRWTPITAPKDFNDLYEYCKQDVRTEREVHRKLGNLPTTEQKVWELDNTVNNRGIPINRKLLNRAIQARDFLTIELEEKAIAGKPFDTLGQRQKVLDWCEMRGYPLEDYTADTIETAVQDRKCPKDVRRVLRARQQCSRSSLKKFDKMIECLCEDGTVKGGFIYHGAHTGRWSGALIQPQNLPRPTIGEEEIDQVIGWLMKKKYDRLLKLDDPTGALVSLIRAIIQPEKGSQFFASDFSNVESRVLFCVAGCESGLNVFRRGMDIYKDMATSIYHVKYKKIDSDQRRMGKLAILGLGYQMGAAKFKLTAAGKGVEIDSIFAKQVVTAYREAYPEVVQLWYDAERAAQSAILNPGKVYEVNEYIKYKMVGTTLLCQLPSKRVIHYPLARVAVKPAPWGGTKDTILFHTYEKGAFREVKTFGGSLVENFVQAICRDLLVHAQWQLEDLGYETRMTIHDELVMTVPIDKGDIKQVNGCMTTLPEWAREWPIEADSWQGMRFRK